MSGEVQQEKSSTRRVRADAGFVDPRKLPKGPNGRSLCRWCSTEVPKGRLTFCGPECVHEWKLRSNPGYVRSKVKARDHGLCAECGRDCNAPDAPHDGRWHTWEADHIVPVIEGGGECGLENYRTLCILCHKDATKALAGRRRNGIVAQSVHADFPPSSSPQPSSDEGLVTTEKGESK